MRPRLIVDNRSNGQVIDLFEPVSENELEARLYMDYGMAKMLIWLFFFAGFFAGAVAIGCAWMLHGT